jgi:signal transduction histidine kinase
MKLTFYPWGNSPTLLFRLTKNITLLTCGLFLLFSAMTVFIAYSIEDALFNKQLSHAFLSLRAGDELPYNIKIITNLSEYDLPPEFSQWSPMLKAGERFKEFSFQDRHFHFMIIEKGGLLIETTTLSVVTRAVDNIFLVLLLALFPALIATVLIAKKASKHALKPVSQITEAFSSDTETLVDLKTKLTEIEEVDIRYLANELITALEQKEEMLDQQITFNQGMSHELRTPLQVIHHSLELLSVANVDMTTQPAFGRLTKSVTRMQRTCNALLWLTSDQKHQQSTDVNQTIKLMLNETQELLSVHQIQTNVIANAQLSLVIPAVVLELMIFTLLTNVIHHCQTDGSEKQWLIIIDETGVTFSNPIIADASKQQSPERFGLGHTLIDKLAKKFELQFFSHCIPPDFVVTIKKIF